MKCVEEAPRYLYASSIAIRAVKILVTTEHETRLARFPFRNVPLSGSLDAHTDLEVKYQLLASPSKEPQ